MDLKDSKNRILKEKIVSAIFGTLFALATTVWTYIFWYFSSMIPIKFIAIPIEIFIIFTGGLFTLYIIYATIRIISGYFYYQDVYEEYSDNG